MLGHKFRKLVFSIGSALGVSPTRLPVAVPEPYEVFGTPLSQEADEFLASCNTAFNERQALLSEKWLRDFDRYDFDLERGVLWLSKDGKKTVEFNVSEVGSIRTSSQTWEWAWNNPNANPKLAVPRSVFQSTGSKFGLKYLEAGMLPVPNDQFGWYLSGIALRLAGGDGVYKAEGEGYEVYLLLRNPRPSDT
jgi:hypothetical protein